MNEVDPQSVTLPDGTTVDATVLLVATMALERLVAKDAMAVIELVEVCRSPGHQPFGGTGATLLRLEFADGNGAVPSDIRAIVLASFSGEGVDLVFTPLA